jgi:hypothetical protein
MLVSGVIYERTNRHHRDHWTPRRKKAIRELSQRQGKSEDEYLRTLIEGELLSQKSFAEILAL